MSDLSSWTPIRVSQILHPTDFSDGSEVAFAHALRVAIHDRAGLTILHSGSESAAVSWNDFPRVRETLERWGLLGTGAGRSAVWRELGVTVEKVTLRGGNPVEAILDFMVERPVDMLVLATWGREGVDRWLKGSVAEPVTRQAGVMTLIVPHGARGCVAMEDGHVTMDRILVPVDHRPGPQPAIDAAMNTVHAFGGDYSTLTLLHVGPEGEMPRMDLPADDRWNWERVSRQGNAAQEIVMAADDFQANLVVMVTAGRRGVLDALRGSTTEQVIRRSPCPVLVVPEGWR